MEVEPVDPLSHHLPQHSLGVQVQVPRVELSYPPFGPVLAPNTKTSTRARRPLLGRVQADLANVVGLLLDKIAAQRVGVLGA